MAVYKFEGTYRVLRVGG